MLKKVIALGVLASLASAAANANLITNGSFESGLTGWTTGGTQLIFPPTVVVTNGVAACCFGEAVPADTVVGGSDDAAGTHGVYFVDDVANQTLTQSLFLGAGTYEVGFDAYAPFNGFANSGDAGFRGTIAGVLLADYTVKTQGTPGQWLHYAGLANVVTPGIYDVTFEYFTTLVPAADVVIDRVYVLASTQGGGTPVGVPEPGTLALLGAALVALGIRRRTNRA